MTNDVMVTIRCITYNHEAYIRQCLEGFVMQKANFRFEAIVHDDASTDGTAAIIREYAEKYPDIIKPIYETENQYSKHDGSLMRIMNVHTHGKYVAMCEGDDYWTDPLKLQKQVDLLEANPEYSLCFHNAMVHYEICGNWDADVAFLKENTNREYTGFEVLEHWTIPTASVVMRKDVIDSSLYHKASSDKRILYGDIVLFLSAAEVGRLYYMSDIMSVYRKHPGGAVYGFNFQRELKALKHDMALVELFGKKYLKATNTIRTERCFSISSHMKKEKKYFRACFYLLKAFAIYPKVCLQLLKSYVLKF